MIDITKLEPRKITDEGRYIDFEFNQIFPLTDEEIEKAREYFNDPNIACKRKIGNVEEKRYALERQQKYKRWKTKEKIINLGQRVALSGVIVIIGVSLLKYIYSSRENYYEAPKNSYVEEYTTEYIEAKREFSVSDNDVKKNNKDQESYEFKKIHNKRKNIIRKYCQIYDVNFATVYNRLKVLTKNFSSDDYLNKLTLDCVSCKGDAVYANSEEELLLYAVRCAKQLPQQMGINASELKTDVKYVSGTDYGKQIGYFADLLGVDKYLIYAIAQAECGFDSDMFLNSNNPAGLKIDGSWWHFSSKEEGFIELCLEVIKYNKIGAYSVEEIATIHAPASDGNENWVNNVTSIIEWAKVNSEKIFGKEKNEVKGKGL